MLNFLPMLLMAVDGIGIGPPARGEPHAAVRTTQVFLALRFPKRIVNPANTCA